MTINQICMRCEMLAPVVMITFNDGKKYPICSECAEILRRQFK